MVAPGGRPDHPRRRALLAKPMQIHILGSAAGGGFPQWNCACENCEGVRSGRLRARPRTQSSIALSADGERWLLVNASPDIRAQIESFAALVPRRGRRDTGIGAVLVVDAQIDHVSGLLFLREGEPIELYCTDPVHEDLGTGLPLIPVLGHYCGVRRHRVPIDGSVFRIPAVPGLELRAIALESKAPPYSPHREDPHPGDNIGLVVEDPRTGGRLLYAPGLGAVDEPLRALMAGCDCLLVDGSFWTEDEMQRRGVGTKPASAMGHLPQSGPGGMVEVLAGIASPRKILVHINNTNPILVEDGPERSELTRSGIEVAHDGMHLEL
jgi:pyrroloquinoline quinone biosynthesis protein B